MYLVYAGNDTVPISMWHGGGVSCTECFCCNLLRTICSHEYSIITVWIRIYPQCFSI